jgi:enoyl-CoA hydratase
MTSALLVEIDNAGIALCTFNRPDKRNALNLEMVEELRLLLQELGADPKVRVLLFHGAGGKSFISGADIAQLRERKAADALAQINSALFREIELFTRPTIACIEGYALGGGCELALACDLRIAGDNAKMGQPEVALGIIPGAGATYRLPRIVGMGRARDLIYTGRIIDADEAHAIGLVNRVVPSGKVVEAGRELGRTIAENSVSALARAKWALVHGTQMSTDAAMAFEATAQALCFESDDKEVRMDRFLAKKTSRPKEPS